MYSLISRLRSLIDRCFVYHPPGGNQPARYEEIRDFARNFAQTVATLTPECREQSIAITKIEEAVFWANAAIARNERWEGGSLIDEPKPPTAGTSDLAERLTGLEGQVAKLLLRLEDAPTAGPPPKDPPTQTTSKRGPKPKPPAPPPTEGSTTTDPTAAHNEGEHAAGDA